MSARGRARRCAPAAAAGTASRPVAPHGCPANGRPPPATRTGGTASARTSGAPSTGTARRPPRWIRRCRPSVGALRGRHLSAAPAGGATAARRAPEHAEEQTGMHAADAHVVAPHIEVRHAIGRIGHARGQVLDRQPAPVQAHHYFGIEIHAPADGLFTDHAQHRRQWIHAEAAHGVAQVQRQRVDPDPDVGGVATVQARLGNTGVVGRNATDHCTRVQARGFDEAWQVSRIMLAVGIDLQHVAVASRAGLGETGQHCPALALVHVQAQQVDTLALCQRAQHRRAPIVRTIVDQQAGQSRSLHAVEHRRDGVLVVVDGNHHQWRECGTGNGRISPHRRRPLCRWHAHHGWRCNGRPARCVRHPSPAAGQLIARAGHVLELHRIHAQESGRHAERLAPKRTAQSSCATPGRIAAWEVALERPQRRVQGHAQGGAGGVAAVPDRHRHQWLEQRRQRRLGYLALRIDRQRLHQAPTARPGHCVMRVRQARAKRWPRARRAVSPPASSARSAGTTTAASCSRWPAGPARARRPLRRLRAARAPVHPARRGVLRS